MPMLYFCWNSNDSAGSKLLRLLAPFLIPAFTGNTDEYLHLLVMDVPVVTATRLEGDIYYSTANVSQVTLTNEILSVGIRLALGPLGA